MDERNKWFVFVVQVGKLTQSSVARALNPTRQLYRQMFLRSHTHSLDNYLFSI